MKDIKCPSCDKVFQIDDSGYSAILKQVHDQEFKQQLDERMKSEVQLAITKKYNLIWKLRGEMMKLLLLRIIN